MRPFARKENGVGYIVQSVLGMALWVALTTVATLRVVAAPELSLTVKLTVCGFLWGLVAYFVILLGRYYYRLPDA